MTNLRTVDRTNQGFSRLVALTLKEASITKRYRLQEFNSNSRTAFFREIGQELSLIGTEITPSSNV